MRITPLLVINSYAVYKCGNCNRLFYLCLLVQKRAKNKGHFYHLLIPKTLTASQFVPDTIDSPTNNSRLDLRSRYYFQPSDISSRRDLQASHRNNVCSDATHPKLRINRACRGSRVFHLAVVSTPSASDWEIR